MKYLKKSITFVFILIIGLAFMWAFIRPAFTVWVYTTPNEPIIYKYSSEKQSSSNNFELYMSLIPDNKLLVWNIDPNGEVYSCALYKIYGQMGHKIYGRIYKTASENPIAWLTGWRMSATGSAPIDVQMELITKFPSSADFPLKTKTNFEITNEKVVENDRIYNLYKDEIYTPHDYVDDILGYFPD